MKIKIYKSIQNEFKSIDQTKKRAHKNFIIKKDLERIYESLFLYSVTLFENYIENLFLWILRNEIKWKHGSKISLSKDYKFISSIDKKHIEKIILWEKWSYLDWLPFSKTTSRAHKFLLDGRPFADLDDNDKFTISHIYAIRNYIAHKSNQSKLKLDKTLPIRFKNIYDLLTRIHSWDKTFFEYYLLSLNSIAWKLQNDLQQVK